MNASTLESPPFKIASYEQVSFTARFLVCLRCGSLVLLWKADVHDRVCPGREDAL